MELLPKPFHGSSIKRYLKRKQYTKIEDADHHDHNNKKESSTTNSKRRSFWKIKRVPKLRLKMAYSPLKLVWNKFKNVYIDAMLSLAGNVGYLNTENTFGSKRIPKGRQIRVKYSNEQIEERIVYEIYKSFMASRELSTI